MSLMGYRSTLLGSVIALTLFYGGGSVIAFYALGPDTLQAWLEARGLWSPDEDGKITPINAAGVATEVCWRVPMPFGHGCWGAWCWAQPS